MSDAGTTGISVGLWTTLNELTCVKKGAMTLVAQVKKTPLWNVQIEAPFDACDIRANGTVHVDISRITTTYDTIGQRIGEAMGKEFETAVKSALAE